MDLCASRQWAPPSQDGLPAAERKGVLMGRDCARCRSRAREALTPGGDSYSTSLQCAGSLMACLSLPPWRPGQDRAAHDAMRTAGGACVVQSD